MSQSPSADELRSVNERESALMNALAKQVAHAQESSPAFAKILEGIDAASINSRDKLKELPITRKSDLLRIQQENRSQNAFGGLAAVDFGPDMLRVFASPGIIFEPQGKMADYWRMSRGLRAAGFKSGDVVQNCFSYHFTPAGFMMDSAAQALGCTVFPAGTGQTEQQVLAMVELQPTAYIGTPSFLRVLLERAQELDKPVSSVKKAMVSGEALPESLRKWFADQGIQVFQMYGTADVGLIAYETSALEGMVVDEDIILEIVDPDTGEPVAEGDIGEVVITTLNKDYPLIRYGTGDLSAVLPGQCPTGRTNTRIRGWMGRADQVTKVRGMFVHPQHVGQIISDTPQVSKARLLISGEMANDKMVLQVEASEQSAELEEKLVQNIRNVTKLRGEVEFVEAGSLPDDGKFIEDVRSYE